MQNGLLREEVQKLRERIRIMDEEMSRIHRYAGEQEP
jgi:hypothetical protein